MPNRRERNAQIRMTPSLWNLVGDIGKELGYTAADSRGGHSAIIREMVAAAAAKWVHSPYVCHKASHTVYVAPQGEIFLRHVEHLRLNSSIRHLLPCSIGMKPEKRKHFHDLFKKQQQGGKTGKDEAAWLQSQWLLNHFSVWAGKKDADTVELFRERPLSSYVDPSGTTEKSADLEVEAVGGRYLTREIIIGLRDYVQWKEPKTSLFDHVGVPINIPTSEFEIFVVVNQDLFQHMGVGQEEIANLALEFRNLESARFEGKEVALYPEIAPLEEQAGRTPSDDGVDEMQAKVRRLWQRVFFLIDSKTPEGSPIVADADRAAIKSAFSELPQRFLFYSLHWPAPHLGIEPCVRWEKPLRGNA